MKRCPLILSGMITLTLTACGSEIAGVSGTSGINEIETVSEVEALYSAAEEVALDEVSDIEPIGDADFDTEISEDSNITEETISGNQDDTEDWDDDTTSTETPTGIIEILKQYAVDCIADDLANKKEVVEDYFWYQMIRSSDLGNGQFAYFADIGVYRTIGKDVLVLPDGSVYDFDDPKDLDVFERYRDYFSLDITDYNSFSGMVNEPTYENGGYGFDDINKILSEWPGIYRLDESNYIEVFDTYTDGTIYFCFYTADASGEEVIRNEYNISFTDSSYTEFTIPYQSGINEIFRLVEGGIEVSLDIDMRGANDGFYRKEY